MMSVLKKSFVVLSLITATSGCLAGDGSPLSNPESGNENSDTNVVHVTASLADVEQRLRDEAEPYPQLCAVVNRVTFKKGQLPSYTNILFSVGPESAPVVSQVEVKDLTPRQRVALTNIVKDPFKEKDLEPLKKDPSGVLFSCVNVPEESKKPRSPEVAI